MEGFLEKGWRHFKELPLSSKLNYINDMIEFFKFCKEVTEQERETSIKFCEHVKRQILNKGVAKGFRVLSNEDKKIILEAAKKLIEISTYSEETKENLKIFIEILKKINNII